MARKPRIDVPGGCYHVMLRGNAGQNIFFSKEDHKYFYRLIQLGVEQYHHRVHAFCCMNNHVHLLIQTQTIPLAKIIQNLSFRYTRWINRRTKRYGHLFQGRYKAILIDEDSYLLQLIRYIHLNPVKAKLAKRPEDYIWSSHRAYLGEEKILWLTTEWVLSQFAKNIYIAQSRYQAFVNQGIDTKYYKGFPFGTYARQVLGDDVFIQKILGKTVKKLNSNVHMTDVINIICDTLKVDLTSLSTQGKHPNFAKARGILAVLITEIPSLTLVELGKILNRDISTLSAQAQRIKKACRSNDELAKQINNIRNLLSKRCLNDESQA